MPDTIAVKDAAGDTVTVKTNDALATLLATLGTQTTSAAILAKLADPATQTTLAAVLAKLSADPATQTTLAAVLAKLSADPATNATLSAIGSLLASGIAVASLPSGLAIETKQDALIAKDFATQTTLAALLAKVIAAPATEAKQDTLIAKDFATQTTLAAVLAKIIAAPATEAKQDTAKAVLDAIAASVAGATPAGTNLMGAVVARLGTSTMYDGTTALTPKFAKIAASSSGNNTLVAAVSSKKIRVLAYNFIGNGAVNAKFQDGAGGTDLTGLKYIDAAGGGICAPFNPVGWFETTANTLLNLNLSGAVAVGGELVYVEV